jgi:DNA-binding transcriptional ArsR family regulator
MNTNTYRGLSVNRLAQALKLLAEPNRLRIVCSLGLECRPVTHIIEATGLEQTNVSFHLRLLREAGLVRAERRGPFIYYCVPDPKLLNILEELNAWLITRRTKNGSEIAPARKLQKLRSAGARAAGRAPKKKKALRKSMVNA